MEAVRTARRHGERPCGSKGRDQRPAMSPFPEPRGRWKLLRRVFKMAIGTRTIKRENIGVSFTRDIGRKRSNRRNAFITSGRI